MEPNDAKIIPDGTGKLKLMYSGIHKTSVSHEFETEYAKIGGCRPMEVLGSQTPLSSGAQEKGFSETLNIFGDRQSNLALLYMLEGIGMNRDEAVSVPCSFHHGRQLLVPALEQQRSWGFQELLSYPICDNNNNKRESRSFDEFLHGGHGSQYDLNLTTSCRRPEWANYNFMQREVQAFELESCITHVSESCTSLVKTEAKDLFSSLDAPEEGVSSSSREPNSSNTVNSSDNCNDKRLGDINGGPAYTASTRERIRKRKRSKICKNTEEVESQRMTHIAVERNRRKQMNEHLTVLRSLMPVSFIQRGDQASIIGGAIDFVKELEQLLQSLQARAPKLRKQCELEGSQSPESAATPFNGFFLSPQYTSYSSQREKSKKYMDNSSLDQQNELTAESKSAIADVEVTVIETHASLKVLSLKRPGQLLKAILALENLDMTILHLNITTIDHSVLYSFNVKIEEDCLLTSANDIATAVHQIFSIIHSSSTNPVRTRVS